VLDRVLAGAPDIITILNADGSWRWSSGAALHLFGHQAEFDAQDWLSRLLHPDDVAVAQEAFTRAVTGEAAPGERFEIRVRAADGSWRLMEGFFDVLLDEPSVGGVVVHTRDVTDRRQVLDELEATNRRLADVISSMKAAVLVEDEHGKVVLANQAFVDLFRLRTSAEQMVGGTLEGADLTLARVVADPPDAAERVAVARQLGQRIETAQAVLVDGRTIEVDFVPTRAKGTDRGNLWAIRDISRQARAEAERERLLVSEREENRRLAEVDTYRSESIAAVSHELRTPLTSIVGYAQLLRNMIAAGQRPEELEYVDAIARNVDRLLRLAGDVVALDSLESRILPLVVGTVDVGDVLRQAAASIAPEAAAKSIDVHVDVARGRLLHGDGDRLVQLFENLLSNAVKFTAPEGHISVAGRSAADEWSIEVADSGIGIPDDEVELLFGRFFRASNARTRGIPGSGLGLSVARAIVERHGGTIAVESAVGEGTTVTVYLSDAPEHGATAG
ncbi:MAG: PAS domain-containing sensor histidine kinase, partial [Acidimicrobiales bacterium]